MDERKICRMSLNIQTVYFGIYRLYYRIRIPMVLIAPAIIMRPIMVALNVGVISLIGTIIDYYINI